MFNVHQTLIRLKIWHLHMQWRKHRDRNRGRGIEERWGERIPEGKYGGETERDRWKEEEKERRSEAQMERDEKGGREKWRDEGVIFHCLFLDCIYYTSTCVIAHIQTLIFSVPLSRLFLSVSPFGFLRQSFAVFICLSVIFRFCLFQQPSSLLSLSSVWGGCKRCCFKYRLCAFYTLTLLCMCERETPRKRQRESKMGWKMTLSGCF